MALLPNPTDFTNATIKQYQAKTFMTSVIDFIAALLGTDSDDKTGARALLGAASTGANTFTGSQTLGAGATLIFEGSSDDAFETTVTVANPTADRTVTFPNASLTVAGTDAAQTFTAPQKSGNVTDNDGSFDLSGAGNNYTSTPTSAVAITFTNIAANAHKSGYIVLTNSTNYAFTAHANTKIATTDLAKIVLTGTYVLPYLCDGTDVMILGAWKKP